jgi:hypothetical protein
LDECERSGKYVIGLSETLNKRVRVEFSCVKPFLRGKQIRRYGTPETDSYLICPYEITANDCRLLTEDEMSRRFPKALAYLELNRDALSVREGGKFKGRGWFAFGYPKSMALFQQTKIVVPDYNNVASFTYDEQGHFFKTGYGVLVRDDKLSPLYILGLLNSKLLFEHLLRIGTSLRGGYVRFWTQYIEQLPIRTIDFSNKADKARHDKMVELVTRMMELKKQQARAPKKQSPSARQLLDQKLAITDQQIDALVYELYGLTEGEIRIVEGGH